MTTIPNPDGWLDAVVILAATAMVAIPSWFAARNHKTINAVKDQVVNGHTTFLRADLDDMKSTLGEIKADVTQIRAEIRQERKDRLELDDRFERFRRPS